MSGNGNGSGSGNGSGNGASGGTGKAAILRVENIIVKSLSLEMPDKVVAPAFKEKPAVKMEMRNSSRRLSQENYYEVTLEMTFRAESGGETQLLIEAVQSGILFLQNADGAAREEALNIRVPEMLYPYLCQLTSDLMQRAGAPRMFLPPFNFRELHLQKKRALKEKLASEGAAPGKSS